MDIGYACSFTVDRVVHAGREWVQPGGPALYSALAAKSMGVRPVVYSAVGFDFLGVWLKKLRMLGVDVGRVGRVGTGLTTMFTITFNPPPRRLYTFNALGLDAYFGRVNIDEKYVYASFTFGEVGSEALHRIIEGRQVFLDVQGFARRTDARGLVGVAQPRVSFEGVRFLKVSHDEVIGEHGIIRRAFEEGVSEVVVTRGGGGAEVHTRDDKYYCPALAKPVRHLNTLGAGDVFGSAYFVSRVGGLGVRESLATATVAAALFIRRINAEPFFVLEVKKSHAERVAAKRVLLEGGGAT